MAARPRVGVPLAAALLVVHLWPVWLAEGFKLQHRAGVEEPAALAEGGSRRHGRPPHEVALAQEAAVELAGSNGSKASSATNLSAAQVGNETDVVVENASSATNLSAAQVGNETDTVVENASRTTATLMAASSETGPEPKAQGVDQRSSSPDLATECDHIYGLPKFTWAIICDILSVVLIVLCVPLLLTCSRRRPPGAPLFDCGEGLMANLCVSSNNKAGLKGPPWMT